MDGVSTYLALTFGTLLSSQGTDASFVLTRRTFSGAFLRALPFGVSSLADPISVSATRWSGLPGRSSAFAFSLSGVQNPTSLFPTS
ncbi:hypothetical protein QMZ92_15820, partial [Streptomyces sp. HNM0645]|uniref:hypothetical protein n=1 Tax=Streptomyces sp. HNM0645 TaxID=2782343 RepID=UPI0024B6A40C